MKWYYLGQLEVLQSTDENIEGTNIPKSKLNTIWQICCAEDFTNAVQQFENYWGDDLEGIKELSYITDYPVTIPENAIEWIKDHNDC